MKRVHTIYHTFRKQWLLLTTVAAAGDETSGALGPLPVIVWELLLFPLLGIQKMRDVMCTSHLSIYFLHRSINISSVNFNGKWKQQINSYLFKLQIKL